MKKKIIKLSVLAIFILSVGFFAVKGNADSTVIMTMANQNVTTDEAFQQARTNSRAEGLFSIVNSQLLEENYGYETNEKVREEVDKQIRNIQENNPDALNQFGVKDMMELMKRTGSYLQIQEQQYTKSAFEKEYVTDKTLRELYDAKAGEMTSFYVIKLDPNDFDLDEARFNEALGNIEGKLATANEDNAVEVFRELIKEYPGSEMEKNEERSVVREEVDELLLKELDKLDYLGFTKKPIEIEDSFYFILKTDKGERPSFEASRQRLIDLQYENATQENQFLNAYLLVKLREANDIKFANAIDERIYNAATQQIISDYNEAKDGGN